MGDNSPAPMCFKLIWLSNIFLFYPTGPLRVCAAGTCPPPPLCRLDCDLPLIVFFLSIFGGYLLSSWKLSQIESEGVFNSCEKVFSVELSLSSVLLSSSSKITFTIFFSLFWIIGFFYCYYIASVLEKLDMMDGESDLMVCVIMKLSFILNY